jgi:hypothetical protein
MGCRERSWSWGWSPTGFEKSQREESAEDSPEKFSPGKDPSGQAMPQKANNQHIIKIEIVNDFTDFTTPPPARQSFYLQ